MATTTRKFVVIYNTSNNGDSKRSLAYVRQLVDFLERQTEFNGRKIKLLGYYEYRNMRLGGRKFIENHRAFDQADFIIVLLTRGSLINGYCQYLHESSFNTLLEDSERGSDRLILLAMDISPEEIRTVGKFTLSDRTVNKMLSFDSSAVENYISNFIEVLKSLLSNSGECSFGEENHFCKIVSCNSHRGRLVCESQYSVESDVAGGMCFSEVNSAAIGKDAGITLANQFSSSSDGSMNDLDKEGTSVPGLVMQADSNSFGLLPSDEALISHRCSSVTDEQDHSLSSLRGIPIQATQGFTDSPDTFVGPSSNVPNPTAPRSSIFSWTIGFSGSFNFLSIARIIVDNVFH